MDPTRPTIWIPQDGAPRTTARVFTFASRQPSLLTRLGVPAALLIGTVLALVVLVPLAVVGIIAFLIGAGLARLRRLITGLVAPNGPLDGRRNVRVIEPSRTGE